MGEAGRQRGEAGLGDYKTDKVMIIIALEMLFQNCDVFHCKFPNCYFSSVTRV